MEALGIVFIGIVAVMVLAAIVFIVVSIPDISRYRRLRRM
jgi:membrane protein YdbS with pleckstrin-like domain